MRVLLILFFSTLLLSCNSHDNRTVQTESKQSGKQPSSINCYRYTSESDTITLKLIHEESSITGTLVYDLKEKDNNTGTIKGIMRDNVLVADYSFTSEGIQSVRQVAFKLEGNSFIEGYGDIFVKNEKVVFKNLDSLVFSSSIRLPEVTCQ